MLLHIGIGLDSRGRMLTDWHCPERCGNPDGVVNRAVEVCPGPQAFPQELQDH